MSDKKILSMIGLAMKAGMVVTGNQGCMTAIKRKKAKLVIIASDTRENALRPMIRTCMQNDTAYLTYSSKDNLGHCTGKSERAFVCITNEDFANKISDMINNQKING